MIVKDQKSFSTAHKYIYENHTGYNTIHPKYYFDKKLFEDKNDLFDKIDKNLSSSSGYRYGISFAWVVFFFTLNLLERDDSVNLDEFIKDDTKYPEIRKILISGCLYRDISIFDTTVFDNDFNVRFLSVDYCSVEKLDKVLKDKEKSIRLKAYGRLGPINYYKKALKDRTKAIRKWGILLAPHFDGSFSKMYNEKSAHNFEELVKKVSKKDLPFFLSPSLLTNKTVSAHVKARIKHEIKKRLS
jgi:hypothetical protein